MSDPASFPFANVARDRVRDRPAEVTDESTLLRLALWLADVAAEAALAATASDAIPTPGHAAPRRPGPGEAPPVAESTR